MLIYYLLAARDHSKTNVWARAFGGYSGGVIPMIISLRDSMELHFVLELQKQKPMYSETSKLS